MRMVSLLFGLALLCGSVFGQPGPGQPAPDFTLPDTAWMNHTLSDYRGQVLVLNFWQST